MGLATDAPGVKMAGGVAPAPIGGSEASARTATFLREMEGREAARAGEPPSANPYEPNAHEHMHWLAGWIYVRRLAGAQGD
jgi:hypothetical protein